MAIVFHESIDTFALATQPFMLAQETLHCKHLSMVAGLQKTPKDNEPPILVEVTTNDKTVGVAMRARTDGTLFLGPMPMGEIRPLVEALVHRDIRLSELQGPMELAQHFVELWCKNTTQTAQVKMQQGCYELTQVIPPRHQAGTMVRATPDDRLSAIELVKQFVYFVDPNTPNLDTFSEKLADRHMAAGRLYLWKTDEGQCVAIAAQVRESPNGASISLVYTLKTHRGCGYASNLVAALSRHVLDEGKRFCNLFTDWTNQTSNRIYQDIGYEELGRSTVYAFTSGHDPKTTS